MENYLVIPKYQQVYLYGDGEKITVKDCRNTGSLITTFENAKVYDVVGEFHE